MTHRTEPQASDHMQSRARDLRRNMSLPERQLWSMLRDRRLGGLKFRRQVPVGPFVVDYLCEKARLVVELDGESHTGTGRADARRDASLAKAGLRVVRVTVDDLIADRDAVAEYVLREVHERMKKKSPHP